MPSSVAESRSAGETSTSEHVRLFKSSLLGRRFPGMRELPDEQIAAILKHDTKASKRALEVKTHPKSDFAPATLPPAEPARIFYPVNPTQARDTAKRQDSECFVNIGTPYNADHTDFVQDKTSDEAKRGPGAFVPTSFSQARDTIRVDYYLNGKGADEKRAELSGTRQRAKEQMETYYSTQTQRRGQMLV